MFHNISFIFICEAFLIPTKIAEAFLCYSALIPCLDDMSSDTIKDKMAVSAVLNYVALPFRTRKTSKASVNKTKKGLRQTPAYTPEEMLFTWYHRTDLKLDWDVVEYLYNKCFNRWPRQKGGLQCKFYR